MLDPEDPGQNPALKPAAGKFIVSPKAMIKHHRE
jgi:hypothetical protein